MKLIDETDYFWYLHSPCTRIKWMRKIRSNQLLRKYTTQHVERDARQIIGIADPHFYYDKMREKRLFF